MNSIYPYPMDGDVVSYKNEEGEYVWGRILITSDSSMAILNGGIKMFIGKAGSIYDSAKKIDLQWIKRKDGTPLVNVGDEVTDDEGDFVTVLEVGVNTFMRSMKNVNGRNAVWKPLSYLELKAAIEECDWTIKRKYPLPDEEVEQFTIDTSPEGRIIIGYDYDQRNKIGTVCLRKDGEIKYIDTFTSIKYQEVGKVKALEVTMDEIAENFGVDVEDLKIKKEE